MTVEQYLEQECKMLIKRIQVSLALFAFKGASPLKPASAFTLSEEYLGILIKGLKQ
jgi:hypothetical protein